jgi:V8-like Glu-specific endopeptidase
MRDPSRLLVISHPVLGMIAREEIKQAIPEPLRPDGWELVEIAPLRAELGSLHELDWVKALAEQERLFDERLRAEVAGRSRLAYFGYAPIPLALHLGYLTSRGAKIDVYQRHHIHNDWAWPSSEVVSPHFAMRPLVLPDHGSASAGPVVIRVSTAHRIEPVDTMAVVPEALAQVDVGLMEPHEDALVTPGDLTEVVKKFNQALAHLKRLFPNLTVIHLFAAIPVGLAFRLGTQINPTIYPEVVTYQYRVKGAPRYQAAIVLVDGRGAAPDRAALDQEKRSSSRREDFSKLPRASEAAGPSVGPRGVSMSDSRKHFLDQQEYDWSDLEAEELYEIMLSAYASTSAAQLILAKSGVDKGSLNSEQTPRGFWKQALEVAASSGHLRKLVESALVDRKIAAYHAKLKQFVSADSPPEEPKGRETVVWSGNELITGKQSTFLEMSFLREGLRVAASVVRLGTVTQGNELFRATGFVIAPNTILTNYHVLHDDQGAPVKQVDIWFNYELDTAGRPREVDAYEGDVTTIVGDAKHDWAVICPRKPFKPGYPELKLRPSKPLSKGDFVFIVQHPTGHPKKIGLLHNEVVSVTSERVQYLTDTLPGSSGSPVCNEFWEVVALHHTGIEGAADQVPYCKNQGVHIERVLEGLIARGILAPAPER